MLVSIKNLFFFIVLSIISIMYGQAVSTSFNNFTSSSHLTLGGSGYLHPSSTALKANPSSFKKYRQFETSFIKYPADIISQSIGYGSIWREGYLSFAFTHLSYGVFKGYDENMVFTKNYSSSSSRFGSTYAEKIKNYPIFLGSNISLVSTNLNIESIYSIKLAIGSHLVIEKPKISLGFSLHEIDIFSNSGEEIKSTQLVLSSSKKLAYLPLTLYIDLLSPIGSNINEYFLGGVFKLKNKLSFSFGSSSRKITQNINQTILKTILGATGLGVSYDADSIIVQYGNYFYGTGSQAIGFSIEVKI